MADKEPEIVARFTPPFEGAFVRGVPQRDLTQQDVDNLTGAQRADVYTPHPGYGTPTYTAVHSDHVDEQTKFAHAALAPAWVEGAVTDLPPSEPQPPATPSTNAQPKWWVDRQQQAAPGTLLPEPLEGETQKQYDARVQQFAPDDAGHEDGAE